MNFCCNTLRFLCLSIIIVTEVSSYRYKQRANNHHITTQRQLSNKKSILGNDYTNDGVNVYYLNIKVDGADPSSFEWLGGEYAKDNFNAYCYGNKLNGADAKSFQVINGPDEEL